MRRLEEVLQNLQGAELKVKSATCELQQMEVEYLGKILNSSSKIDACNSLASSRVFEIITGIPGDGRVLPTISKGLCYHCQALEPAYG